ncbi:glycosyltransferase [Cytobacillus oceanisediminis]|uniref:glycosyltransferase n=1 Tax=Cytobacillus oceanisediminis TaxID=665099 RepID=UPI001C238182|nr:glycosyltransferase [Cytobacillus oceanisediminis]MBU8769290.1 glycosyltransferase [Cytobacillus oceanisediminis]
MTAFNPLVSVIIPFYNCSFVGQAIESVLMQTYQNIELIVVNDGSSKYHHLISPFLKKIVYLEQSNKGTASALNQGLKHANGEYLVWLSSDDLINPNKIEYQLNFMKEKNSLVSFTNFNKIDKENRIIKYNAGLTFNNNLEILLALQNYNIINGCTVMMLRRVFETVGGFNEKLKYTQDYEYWLRIAFHYRFDFYPITLTNQRIHEEMGTNVHLSELLKEFEMVKNLYRNKLTNLIKVQSFSKE